VVNPKKRATILQIKDHPWLNNGVTFLNGLEDEVLRIKPKDESELDFDILDQIEQIGYEKDAVKASLLENKFDPAAGAYYIFGYQKRKDAAAFNKAVKAIASEQFKKEQNEINEGNNVRGEDETSAALAQLLLQAQRDEDPGSSKTLRKPQKPLPATKQPIKKGTQGNYMAQKHGIISLDFDTSAVKPHNSRRSTEESLPKVVPTNKKDSCWQPKHSHLPPIPKANLETKTQTDNAKTKLKGKERKLTVDETLYINEISKSPSLGVYGIPRTIKQAFNCTAASAVSPDELFDKLKSVLDSNDVEWTYDKYLFDVDWKSVHLEIEICKIPHMALHGLRFKKISGDIWQFKNMTNEICTSMGIV
jgi:hypothetical protein